MSSFFWNVRGLNKPIKHSVIKKWVAERQFSFGCLIETRVKENKVERVFDGIFKDWSMLSNYEHNRLGRLWVVWKNNVRLTPYFKSSQIITVSVKLEDFEEEFFCSFIYASNTMEERKELWNDLRDHHNSSIVGNKAWVCLGDFNETLDIEEHSGSDTVPNVTRGMKDFQELVNHCSLVDMAFHGPLYTWCNKRESGLISKKLDRVLTNDAWRIRFPQSYNVFESGGCSDHLRGRIHIQAGKLVHKRKPFKFVNAVTELEDFKPKVANYWSRSEPIFLSTASLFRFSKKLKGLKPLIRKLAKDKMGNLVKKSKEAYNDLCEKQEKNHINPTTLNMEEENEAAKRWEFVAGLEEKFLKQRSKLHWMKVGDQCSKAFHRAVMVREAKNSIREIVCPDGRVVSKGEDIKTEAERFFRDFLQHSPEDYEGMEAENIEELLQFRCTADDSNTLIKIVTPEEIKRVLFSMPNDKSPGPDGYTSEFFKSAWEIVGNEFTIAVQAFFVKGFLPKGINTTIIALIPKKTEAKEMKDYRPISCCNVLYKVISKIIANRLKRILPKFISANQSAFVKDRLLIENLLLATEIVKDYHKDTILARCAIKVDISKAFDSLQWSFLLNVLKAMNFPDKFIHWISLCITTSSFSVQVNGELAGYFQSKRGLRQGCALSPYLFVIAMDVLSKSLDKAANEKMFGYHPRCKVVGLTHLSFADDIMVLSDGNIRSVEGIVKVFDEFAKVSGLRISLEKTTVYLAGVTDSVKQKIEEKFDFNTGQLPVRYLGLPLLTRSMTPHDYMPLLESIKKRFRSWTARALSYAGRLELIRSVIWSVVNFWMGAYSLPRSCIREIERMCTGFLWSGIEQNTSKAKIGWDVVCLPKEEGGLGLRSLKEANEVCSLKLLWRIASRQKSLWVQWIYTYLLKHESIWAINGNTQTGSWMWRKILKCRSVARTMCKSEIHNGNTTSFWHDIWSNMGSIMDITGSRGIIDMGISRYATIAEAWGRRCKRRHRSDILVSMEQNLQNAKDKQIDEEDVVLWKGKGDTFKSSFNTRDTWNNTRTVSGKVAWHKALWFSHSTPKYVFCAWLAIQDRLSTGDRMMAWNVGVDTSCVLCNASQETRNHLFFSCSYSMEVWQTLVRNIMKSQFSEQWTSVVNIISARTMDRNRTFIVRYVFQAALHSIWRERNGRRHGDNQKPTKVLIKHIDRQLRARFLSIRKLGDRRYDEGLQIWLGSLTSPP